MLLDPGLVILTAFDLIHPGVIVQIPLNGLPDSGFKRLIRQPAQFFGQFAEVDRIPEVMTGPIFDKPD